MNTSTSTTTSYVPVNACPYEDYDGNTSDVATRKYGDFLSDLTSETAAERRAKRLALAQFAHETPHPYTTGV